jgi:hypothetical protein
MITLLASTSWAPFFQTAIGALIGAGGAVAGGTVSRAFELHLRRCNLSFAHHKESAELGPIMAPLRVSLPNRFPSTRLGCPPPFLHSPIGEISRDLETAQGARTELGADGRTKSKEETLADAGISTSTANRYEELAGGKEKQAQDVATAGGPIRSGNGARRSRHPKANESRKVKTQTSD